MCLQEAQELLEGLATRQQKLQAKIASEQAQHAQHQKDKQELELRTEQVASQRKTLNIPH